MWADNNTVATVEEVVCNLLNTVDENSRVNDELESALNTLVYNIYGLTQEEINAVERTYS